MRIPPLDDLLPVLAVLLLGMLVAALPAGAVTGDCAQPLSTGVKPATSDCLFILRSAVGFTTCDPLCICDPNDSGEVTSSDALLCLRSVVGQPVALNCPCSSGTLDVTKACDDDCKRALQVCGSSLFFDTYSSVQSCTDECVEIVDDYAIDAADYDACSDSQTLFIQCCTEAGICGQIPETCDPEFFDAVESCGGSFGGCPLIFF